MSEAGLSSLTREELEGDPVEQFRRWFRDAREEEALELPGAMCLSTVDDEGRPEGRMVLLKDADETGFSFYTNLASPKGRRMLKDRPWVALTFHWNPLERQVRITGRVERLPDDVADAYFDSRPRDSQIGAWASEQSMELESRELLEERYRQVEERYRDGDVPRPPHWGGLRVVPRTVEFWQGRPGRLHDRFRYQREEDGWKVVRLYP